MKRMAPGLAPRSFHSLFHDGVSTGLSDKELLERFAASRDSAGELAFATLVARHGPMVLSVCRRMLRDPHDSEDAFQATFLDPGAETRGHPVRGIAGPLALWRERSSCPPCSSDFLASSLDRGERADPRPVDRRPPRDRSRPPICDRRLPGRAAGKLSRRDRLVLPRRAHP